MIIVNKSGYLFFKKLKFRCAIGRAGIKIKKEEGDCVTPKGIYELVKVLYRSDRIKNIKTNLKKIKIKKNMGWCDDPNNIQYNKQVKIPANFSYEKLYRTDKLYDLIIVLSYNMFPVIKNKGSAIFIHIASKNYRKTNGCIALKKKNLLALLSLVNKKTKIKIH